MWGARRTLYSVEPPSTTTHYRCRNTHTLSPLFSQFDSSGELITTPQPIDTIPSKYFYRNSDGFGFDVRNLGVLLRTNFRNMNPHTLDDRSGSARPLWCSGEDLQALIHHPQMNESVRDTVRQRTEWLNLLSDASKSRLAETACELYSATLQGFYNWVAALEGFDCIMTGMGIGASRTSILVQIEDLQRQRHQTTIKAIKSTLGTQASEHFCEPPGLVHGELYDLLEFYKGGVAQKLIEHIEQLGERRRLILHQLRSRVESYSRTRLSKIIDRYIRAAARRPARRREELLFRIAYAQPNCGAEFKRAFKPRSRMFRPCPAPLGPLPSKQRRWRLGVEAWLCRPNPSEPPLVEIRFDTPHVGTKFVVSDSTEVLEMLDDMVPRFLPGGQCRVALASLAGAVLQRACPGKRSRSLYRAANRLLRSLAEQWLARTSVTETVERLLVDGPSPMLHLTSMSERVHQVRKALRRRYRDSMFRVVAHQMARSAPDIFELQVISVQLSGGYDDFTGTLLDKLRATMSGRTCAQDIGGELCEMLSCPYPPEAAERFTHFQVDHTGVPPLIRRHLSGWGDGNHEPTPSFDRSVHRLLHPILETPWGPVRDTLYSITHL